MKILISGGHLTPALAFIDYALELKRDSFVFVGRPFSQTELRQKSQEESEVTKRGVPFVAMTSGKLMHFGPIYLFQQGLQFFRALYYANQIFQKNKPDLFL